MQIQIHTDSHTADGERLEHWARSEVIRVLDRFSDRTTRVEVHLTDENGSGKSSDSDKRCVMESRLAGLQPITVSADGSSLEQALRDAAEKMKTKLERTIGRLDDPKGRSSFAGNETT